MVKDIRGGSSSGLGNYGFTELAGSLYFAATDGSNNSELWKTDGTSGGTMMVKDIKVVALQSPKIL
jgi:ELWxxDGT repeat protein